MQLAWTKEDMKAADVKTWKILTMHGNFHHKSNTQKILTNWNEAL